MRPWRKIEKPEIGQRAWLHSTNFPAWRWRKEVKIAEITDGNVVAEVEAGTWSRRVYIHHLDCGREFRTGKGEWIHESDPRVMTWLVKAIGDIDAGGTKVEASQDPEQRARTRDDLLWVLRRNGWRLP